MRRQHLLIQSGLLIVSLVLAGTMTMAWAYPNYAKVKDVGHAWVP
jgi:hypothetical protein